jgi:hypothetical protein
MEVIEMEKLSFGGWSTENRKAWNETFEVEYNDDGTLVLVSKEKFNSDDPDLNFEYRFVVEAITLDDGTINVCLYMVPLPAYWAEERLKSIAESYGYETLSKDELINNIYMQDAIQEGLGVPFANENVEYDIEKRDEYYDLLDCPQVVEKLDSIASVFSAMNALRGFSLDAPKNRLGTTGWDMLEHILNNADLFQPALDRAKERLG